MKRESLYFTAPGRVEVRHEELPGPGPGEALVRSIVSSLSAGTEMHFFRGDLPSGTSLDLSIPSLNGTARYPFKYGYSVVGRVEALGEGVPGDWMGRTVLSLHPHESRFAAPLNELVPVPEDIGAEEATFLPNMETAVNLVQDGGPSIGEDVFVLGQGVVGLLTTALLSRMPLGQLVTVDPHERRRQLSLQMGAHGSHPSSLGAKALLGLAGLGGRGADLVYEVSGNPAALGTAVDLAGFGGRVVVGSWYGGRRAEVGLGSHFHRDRVRISSSQVSTVAPGLAGRWDKARRLGLAWEMLRRVRPGGLVTHRLPFLQAQEAYELLGSARDEVLQVVLEYGGGD